jgi:hypothetical protein
MNQHCGSHGKNHAAIETLAEDAGLEPGDTCSVGDYNELCAETVAAQCGCSKECIQAQLNAQAKDRGVENVKHVDTNSSANISEFKDKMLENTELDVTIID